MRRSLAFLGRAPLRVTGVVVVCSVAVACQLIAGIDDRSVADSGVSGDGGPPPDGDLCSSAGLPSAPDQSTSSPSDSLTVTAALRQVFLGQTDGGPYYGFNLDGTCTCPGPDSCTRSGGQACDDPNGVDNYARRIFEQANQVASIFLDGGLITEQKFNAALTTGASGALIEISSYNGQADDAAVTVTVYASLGFQGFPTPPSWDGGDFWTIDQASAGGTFTTSNAYVSNYELVASLDSFPIIVGTQLTQPVKIQLDSGLIKAKLDMTGGVFHGMQGTLGGRWDPAKFLPSLQDIPDPLNDGGFLCGDAGTYQLLKSIICKNTDVNASPTVQNGICNAVSMGLDFLAVPAQLGSTAPAPDAATPCGPAWTDHCN
jgi:hypothetical protein